MTVVENAVRLSCTENAALLSTITKVPGADVRNALERDRNAKDGGFLTLEQELTLTKALARLSGITKNPNHITAVCVEQKLEGPELIVRVAINKASPGDGQGILSRVVEGFDGIFLLLVKLSNDHRNIKQARSQVLREIISLCHQNMLDRLGSSSAVVPQVSPKRKSCLSKTLHGAIAALRSIGAQTQHKTSIEQLEGLQTLVQEHAECGDSQHRICPLQDILVLCRRLINSTSLEDLLDLLPNTSLCPSARSSMARRIAKLGQYADISKQLCSLVLEVPTLAAMRAAPVMLPPETLRTTVPASYKPDLQTTFARSAEKMTDLSTNLDDICKELRTARQNAGKKFAKDVRGINRDAKCHAEVQILFEYEIRPHQPAPRVVASSKSACFLCNALFRAHGKYHIPRTHGRLYRGWKLPAVQLATMEDVEAKFADALECAIRQSLKSMLKFHGSLKLYYPNESTLTIRSSFSLSTVTTDAVSENPTPVPESLNPEPAQPNYNSEEAAVESQGCSNVSHELRPAASNSQAEQMEHDHSVVLYPDAQGEPPKNPTSIKLSPSSSQTGPGDIDHRIITLQQGEVRAINLHPGVSHIIRTRNLYVHIELPTKNLHQRRLDDSCIPLMAEWLSVEDADRHASARAIHEARNLSTVSETKCSGREDVILGLGDEIIKIRRMED